MKRFARMAPAALAGAGLLAGTMLAAGAALGAAAPVALRTTELGQGPTLVFVHELGAGLPDDSGGAGVKFAC